MARVSDAHRWAQLAVGVGAMVMIANYQYGWTFFVPDIQKSLGSWDRASIQLAFTLFVLFETWLVPIEGWFVDKYGTRLVVLIGGGLCAIGWLINSEATSLNGYALPRHDRGGHWRRRRLWNLRRQRAEMVSGQTRSCGRHHRSRLWRGFGAHGRTDPGDDCKDWDSRDTFLYFGLGQGIIIVILAFFLFAPKPGQVPVAVRNANVIQTRRDFGPGEVILAVAIFWLMYFMFVMASAPAA